MNAYVRLVRPKQWAKNLLVFAVPIAAGKIFDSQIVLQSAVGFVVLSLSASAIYVLNDILDREHDRQHSTKKNRPIASGAISVAQGKLLFTFLFLFLVGILSTEIARPLVLVVIVYVATSLVYAFWIKHIAIIDLVFVSSGFVIRAIAGGVITGLPISAWFLCVAGSTAMFIVSGKRYSELLNHHVSLKTRKSLEGVTKEFLQSVWQTSQAAAIVFYALWATDIAQRSNFMTPLLSAVPFALLMFLYAQQISLAKAESPEDLLIHNRSILITSFVWLGLLGASTHIGS